MKNKIDQQVIEGFGFEWSHFDQSNVPDAELAKLFSNYFSLMPWHELPAGAVAFDAGCGSGRWARFVAPRVATLHCLDASPAAIEVARRNLTDQPNCVFHCATVEKIPLPDASMDVGYSLGVLHHVEDTARGLRACVTKLKPGAPFLVYLYYALDNRPLSYRLLWRVSDLLRGVVSRLPAPLRLTLSYVIATSVYWPAARFSLLLERLSVNVEGLPLSFYRRSSFATMATDALDRFGTRRERRFARHEIQGLMELAGLERVRFREAPPYWCALGYRRVESRP